MKRVLLLTSRVDLNLQYKSVEILIKSVINPFFLAFN